MVMCHHGAMENQLSFAGALILAGVVGSTAYGLATPESDVDTLGVFQAPTRSILGIQGVTQSVVQTKPDLTMHELGKFVDLCLANNPTVMELLWLDSHTACTPAGKDLVRMRDAFLSNRVRRTYGGYARQQHDRLIRRGGTFSSDTAHRTAKHARHCYRLLIQGRQLLETGTLNVRLSDKEADSCWAIGQLALEDLEEFSRVFEEHLAEFDAAPSVLPTLPNVELVERILVQLRLEELES